MAKAPGKRKGKRLRPKVLNPGVNGVSKGRDSLSLLHEKLRVQERRLRMLKEMSQISRATFEIESLIPVYLDLLTEEFGADAAALLMVDRFTERASLRAIKDGVKGDMRLERVVSNGEVALWASLTPASRLHLELEEDLERTMVALDLFGFLPSSLISSPLKMADQVVGYLKFARLPGPSPFSMEDLDLLEFLAPQLAIVLENARLFLETERRVGQLATLMDLSTVINSTLERKEVLRRAMEAATRLMGCEVGSLLLIDQESRELVFEVALGEKGDRVREICLKLGEGIAGWVAERGEPLLVSDAYKDLRFSPRADERSKFTTRNMLCVPVRSKGRVIGVLQAINKLHGDGFLPEDIGLFESLANQVAIAIENASLYEEVRETFLSTAEALADAIEKRDPYTGGHTKRVQGYCLCIGRGLSLNQKEMENLRLAAILHDVGKIGIDDAILRKQEGLEKAEFAAIMEHPRLGAEIMGHIKQLRDALPGIRHHQERQDGSGYPDRLRDKEIPLVARIIAVADAFDAMTTDRPYRTAFSDLVALEEIKRCAGTQFDKQVVDAFLRAYERGEIRKKH